MSNYPLMYRPAVLKARHVITNEQFMEVFEPHFASQLRNYDKNPTEAVKKARHIACTTMKIRQRYFAREPDTLHIPLTPQQQRDMFIKIGLEMSVPTVKQALVTAGIDSVDINCIIFVSHQPFPFPPFTAHLMNAMHFHQDCSQVPVTSMGCAGGGFALDAARTYLNANPAHNVLVLCVEFIHARVPSGDGIPSAESNMLLKNFVNN